MLYTQFSPNKLCKNARVLEDTCLEDVNASMRCYDCNGSFTVLNWTFSNSLIIHQAKTKKITTVEEVWKCDLNYLELLLWISPRIINSLRSYIKHSKECFLLFPNTSKLVKKTRLRLVFPTYISVFGNRRKHSSSCLIYYLNSGSREWKGKAPPVTTTQYLLSIRISLNNYLAMNLTSGRFSFHFIKLAD